MRVDLPSKENQDAYYRHLEDVKSMRNVLENAKEEARWEGRQEERMSIARDMKTRGMTKDLIIAVTNISISEFDSL